jgi:hypothetical protein
MRIKLYLFSKYAKRAQSFSVFVFFQYLQTEVQEVTNAHKNQTKIVK